MKKYKLINFILVFLSIICILYSVALCIFVSFTNVFHYFFAFLGICFFVLRMILSKVTKGTLNIPKWLKRTFYALCILGSICFCIIEGFIIHASVQKTPENLDYLIILGGGLRGDKPSLTLAYRLDRGYEYLLENENTKVIVSGGQGFDEPIAEAEAMAQYLINKGLDKNRILLETESTSTYENLKFSRQILMEQETNFTELNIGIVSNDFHIFRALHIAKELSYEKVHGCSAKSVIWLVPNNYLREAFAVVKDCIF